jgi:hypothetical protein
MPLRRPTKLPSFSGVAAGQTATIEIPAFGTYYDLTLEYSESGSLVNQATIETAIEEIRVKINGTVVRRMSAQDLIDLNAYHGVAFQDGYLPIFFAEPWMKNAPSVEALAWGMNDVQSFQLEVDIATGRTAPALKAVATRTLATRNLGAIKKIAKFQVAVAGTGITNYQTLPRTDAYQALHARSGDVDDVKITVDNVEVFEQTADQIAQHINNSRELSPVTGYFHIPFNVTGLIEDLLPMVNPQVDNRGNVVARRAVQDFQIDFNMSAASGFTLLAETLGEV